MAEGAGRPTGWLAVLTTCPEAPRLCKGAPQWCILVIQVRVRREDDYRLESSLGRAEQAQLCPPLDTSNLMGPFTGVPCTGLDLLGVSAGGAASGFRRQESKSRK